MAEPAVAVQLLSLVNGVGKRSLAWRAAHGVFPGEDGVDPTIEEHECALHIANGNDVHLRIIDNVSFRWCEGGLNHFAFKAALFVIVFDVTNGGSFHNGVPAIRDMLASDVYWADASAKAAKIRMGGFRIVLAGCRCDLRASTPAEQCVTPKEGAEMARKIGALAYVETSARTGQGVLDVFRIFFTFRRFPAARRATLALLMVANRADRGALQPLLRPLMHMIARQVWESRYEPVWDDAMAPAPPPLPSDKCVIA